MWIKRIAWMASVVAVLTLGPVGTAARASAPAPAPAPLRVLTSDLPPLAIQATPGHSGALVEIVNELLKRTAHDGKVEFVPWQRAIFLTDTMPRTLIFPLSRSPERELKYRWLARLHQEHFLFLALASSSFDLNAPATVKQRRIGVLRGSHAMTILKELGYRNLVQASTVDESLRYLRRGIVDTVFGNRAIYRASLQDAFDTNYRAGNPVRTATTWLGGSADVSDADVAAFERALQAMVDDGSYARILKKYALEMMPAPQGRQQ